MQHIIQCSKIAQVMAENRALRNAMENQVPHLSIDIAKWRLYFWYADMPYDWLQCAAHWQVVSNDQWVRLRLGDNDLVFRRLSKTVVEFELGHAMSMRCGRFHLDLLIQRLHALFVEGLPAECQAALRTFLHAGAKLID